MENYKNYTVSHLPKQNEIQILGGKEKLNEEELKSIAKEFNIGNFYIISQEVWGKYFEYYKFKIIYGMSPFLKYWQGIEGEKPVKIEVLSDSMNDDSRKGFSAGDQVYCSVLPIDSFFSYESLNKVFCFFHNTRGIIFKKVKSLNIETGEIELCSLNKDKDEFPDFFISLEDCKYILKLNQILRNQFIAQTGNEVI